MRLSTRGRFAITALIDLALRESHVPVPLAELALRHRISLSYLEQVFAKLRHGGLVESTRGPGGGYTLGFRGDQISVADIIVAIEDDGIESRNVAEVGSAYDLTQDLWNNLHSVLMTRMKSITLQSLALDQQAKGFVSKEHKRVKNVIQPKPQSKSAPTNAPNSVFTWDGAIPVRD